MVIQVFNFEGNNGNNKVRVIEQDGEPWFVAKDVCNVLGMADVTSALRTLDDDEKQIYKIIEAGQSRNMAMISVSGLYTFIMRSNKPQAKRFRRWITSDVISPIRKTRKTGRCSVQAVQASIPSGVMESAKLIFMSAGITENQLALALDKVYKSYVGRSALEAGEIVLTVPANPAKHQNTHEILTPAEIGSHFGLSGQRVNEILAGAGYQHKIAGKWEPLEPGEPFAVMLEVWEKHSSGVPMRQLKWDGSILDELKRII